MPGLVADAAARTFGVGLVLSMFLFGFRHGIDWDHIAAITDIAGSQENRRDAMLFGSLYALGHALVVFVIGSVAILLGKALPDGVDNVMQRIVGVTLLVLGVFVIVSLVRHGREFRMRSRWMLIFSGGRNLYRRFGKRMSERTDDHDLEPVHIHADGGDVALMVEEDVRVSEWHHGHHGRPGHHHHKHPEPDDPFMSYGRASALIVGMIHGVGAETPTQVVLFLAAATLPNSHGVVGEVMLGAFIVGLLSSNSLITFGSASGFLKASENWKVYVTIALLTASFSLVIGTLFIFGKATLLPVIGG